MTLRPALLACAIALVSSSLGAAEQPKVEPPKYKSAQEIIDAAPAEAWRTLDPANTLYMELETGRVIIELAPQFAPEHVANIRTMAREHFWDGLSIYRSQDNFVVQFGDPNAGEAGAKSQGTAKAKLPAEFTRKAEGLKFSALPDPDGWAPEVGFVDGFPAARDPKTGEAWLTHCYGTLGAGRDTAPDSSNGSELYVVSGQSPRQLDRNITTVGRVVKGMDLLSVIPRGPEPMGFYDKSELRTPIKAIKLASDVPEAERTALQLLRTGTPTFAAATEARRNRRDGWYVQPAGHIDVCNVPLPARTLEQAQAQEIRNLQNSHVAANVPTANDFDRFLTRDLLAYFRANGMPSVSDVEYKLLRNEPTQSGVAYPKYYAWVKAKSHDHSPVDGAVRVAAIDGKAFEVTSFISRSEIISDKDGISSVFPALLVEQVTALAESP